MIKSLLCLIFQISCPYLRPNTPNPFCFHQNNTFLFAKPSINLLSVPQAIRDIHRAPLLCTQLLPRAIPYHQFWPETDINKFRMMIGRNNFTFKEEGVDEAMKKFYSAKKITPYLDKKLFYDKLKSIINKRRECVINHHTDIPVDELLYLIYKGLEFNERQIGLFVILFNFAGRGFTTCGKCIRFKNSHLFITKGREYRLHRQFFSEDIFAWRRLNFKFDTVHDAWEILTEIVYKMSLKCFDETREKFVWFFKQRVFEDMISLWG